MIKKLQLLSRYVKFRMKAGNAYSIHSPFVYDLYTEVLKQAHSYVPDAEVLHIEKIAKELFRDKRPFEVTDTGEKSRVSKVLTVGQKAKAVSQSKKGGRILSHLAKKFYPQNIIELGTGVGIGTLYMACASRKSRIITIEGNTSMAAIAREVFEKSEYEHIFLREGLFNDLLPEVLQEVKQADMVFIDGDHKGESLLRYYEMLKPYLSEKSILVLHDIYWSRDMLSAWKQIVTYPEVQISVDLFHFGLLFFGKSQAKQHFQLRV